MINILKLRKLEKEKKQLQQDQPAEEVKSESSQQDIDVETFRPESTKPEMKAPANSKKTKSVKTKKETAGPKKAAKPVEAEPAVFEEPVAELKADEPSAEANALAEENLSQPEEETVSVEFQPEADPFERFRQELIAKILEDETMITRDQLRKELEEQELKESQQDESKQEIEEEIFAPLQQPPVIKSEPAVVPKAESAYKPEPVQKVETRKQEAPGIERDERIDLKNKKALDSVIQLVGFDLGREYYGIEINRIKEINRMTEITKVPRAPGFIEGVINLRGSVIPVINLRTKVRMPKREYDKNTRIIIVELKGKTIGFIVDAVREVLRIPENLLDPPPVLSVGRNAEYISAVAKLEDELVILMDPEKLLSNEETMRIA